MGNYFDFIVFSEISYGIYSAFTNFTYRKVYIIIVQVDEYSKPKHTQPAHRAINRILPTSIQSFPLKGNYYFHF